MKRARVGEQKHRSSWPHCFAISALVDMMQSGLCVSRVSGLCERRDELQPAGGRCVPGPRFRLTGRRPGCHLPTAAAKCGCDMRKRDEPWR